MASARAEPAGMAARNASSHNCWKCGKGVDRTTSRYQPCLCTPANTVWVLIEQGTKMRLSHNLSQRADYASWSPFSYWRACTSVNVCL